MSEFYVRVVQVGEVQKHPNADTLSFTFIGGPDGYPVVFRTGEFKPGDKAVYVPIDALVPGDDPRWAHLLPKGATPPLPGSGALQIEIEAKRLRGMYSMGILTPADSAWAVGQLVHEELRIVKAEPPEPSLGNEVDPGLLPVFTDIKGLRAHPDVLQEGELVVLTEKIHGESCRLVYSAEAQRLYYGSRTFWKDPAGGPAGGVEGAPLVQHAGWEVVRRLGIERRMKDLSGIGVFGELYGDAGPMQYDAEPTRRGIRIFAAMHVKSRTYLDFNDMVEVARMLEVPTVPVLYRGPWKKELISYAEGQSTMARHIREGFVVQTMPERQDPVIGRVILKRHGERFNIEKRKHRS